MLCERLRQQGGVVLCMVQFRIEGSHTGHHTGHKVGTVAAIEHVDTRTYDCARLVAIVTLGWNSHGWPWHMCLQRGTCASAQGLVTAQHTVGLCTKR